jgi:hypothetical protein
VRSLTDVLDAKEAVLLREAFFNGNESKVPLDQLSETGQVVRTLLSPLDSERAEETLRLLPSELRERLSVISPVNYVGSIHSPLIVFFHDVEDKVVPIGESRRFAAAFSERPGVHYIEMRFQHLDPRKLPILTLVRELGKFWRAIYLIFRRV